MINRIVILICGKQGSGKTTTAAALTDALSVMPKCDYVLRRKFAGTLYEMHDAVLFILERDTGYKSPHKKDGKLLQLLGTEWGRAIDPDIWARAALGSVLKSKPITDDGFSVHIFDDCRFENELTIFDNIPHLRVLKIYLICDEDTRKQRAEMWRENTSHPSETGLDHLSSSAFDAVFDTTAVAPDAIAANVRGLVDNLLFVPVQVPPWGHRELSSLAMPDHIKEELKQAFDEYMKRQPNGGEEFHIGDFVWRRCVEEIRAGRILI